MASEDKSLSFEAEGGAKAEGLDSFSALQTCCVCVLRERIFMTWERAMDTGGLRTPILEEAEDLRANIMNFLNAKSKFLLCALDPDSISIQKKYAKISVMIHNSRSKWSRGAAPTPLMNQEVLYGKWDRARRPCA